MVRGLAVLLTLGGLAVGLALVVADPDVLSTVARKLGEGGMWTALAVFVVVAAILGAWPRDAAGRLRRPFSR